jgi:hypothetical protein
MFKCLLFISDVVIASIKKCHTLLGISTKINEVDVLKRLHYVNALGLETFCAFMHKLPNFIEQQPNVRYYYYIYYLRPRFHCGGAV